MRANVADEDAIRMLAETGLRGVWTGIECGDEAVAKNVLDRGLDNAQLLRSFEILKKYNVLVMTTNLLGLPVPNSYETDLKTLDMNIAVRPNCASANLVYPYPKTALHAIAERDGFLPHGVPPLESSHRHSALTFPDVREQRRVENLQKLFDWIVQYPFLRPYCDFLCDLPLAELYRLLFHVRLGYSYKWKFLPIGSLRRELWMWLGLLYRRMRRT
jgi:radical SAM superfamily enzyme YgiQ (UPF0313 family)